MARLRLTPAGRSGRPLTHSSYTTLGDTINAYDKGTSRRRSAIDGRTTRHDGYAISQKKRKRIEEIFGWLKTVGGQR